MRPSVNKSSSSSVNPNSSLSSPNVVPTYVSATEHATETMMIPRRRNYRRRNKVVRRNSSLKSKNNINTIKRTNHQQTRRIQLETCICSWKGCHLLFLLLIIFIFLLFLHTKNCTYTRWTKNAILHLLQVLMICATASAKKIITLISYTHTKNAATFLRDMIF